MTPFTSTPCLSRLVGIALCWNVGYLSGAGGGGFMMLFVPPEAQPRVKETFSNLVHVPFKFERNGSQIIHCENEEDYESLDMEREKQNITPFRELSDLKHATGK